MKIKNDGIDGFFCNSMFLNETAAEWVNFHFGWLSKLRTMTRYVAMAAIIWNDSHNLIDPIERKRRKLQTHIEQ